MKSAFIASNNDAFELTEKFGLVFFIFVFFLAVILLIFRWLDGSGFLVLLDVAILRFFVIALLDRGVFRLCFRAVKIRTTRFETRFEVRDGTRLAHESQCTWDKQDRTQYVLHDNHTIAFLN
jgi:hypothetical protein